MEAEYNYNDKKVGRDIMNTAKRNKLLSREQYVSRKNKRAIDQTIHKQLIYDIINLQRRSSLLFSIDAKSCYDRIVHYIASLALQRLGIPV